MELKELMEGFAAACGISGMATDDDGVYHLGIDDMEVSFMSLDETRQLAIWAEVGEPPPEGRERIYRALLESMHLGRATGGSTFSIDSDTGKVFLFRLDSLQLLDLDAFTSTLERFVNVLEPWRKIVAGLSAVAPQLTAAETAAAEESRQMGIGKFLQV